VLQKMGFAAVARHRSREVMLYRQGSMNLIVNADPGTLAGLSSAETKIAAVALRVRDAAFAHRHSLDLGAWEMPTRASAMELKREAVKLGMSTLRMSALQKVRDGLTTVDETIRVTDTDKGFGSVFSLGF